MADEPASTSALAAAGTELDVTTDATITAEDQAQAVKESQAQCQAVKRARDEMTASDRAQLDAVADSLRPHFLCNHCKNLLLEPWLVKDCGHSYCFRCLHSMVYDTKVRHHVRRVSTCMQGHRKLLLRKHLGRLLGSLSWLTPFARTHAGQALSCLWCCWW